MASGDSPLEKRFEPGLATILRGHRPLEAKGQERPCNYTDSAMSRRLWRRVERRERGYEDRVSTIVIIIIIVVAVAALAILTVALRRRSEQRRQRRERLASEAAGHRQEADAHASKAQEVKREAETQRRSAAEHEALAEDHRTEAERHAADAERHAAEAQQEAGQADELEERVPREGRAAAFHDEKAAEREQELDDEKG